jgi:nitrite reductase/ring-hydroxylating ferredoxin subunit
VTWLAACRLEDIPEDRGWPVRVGGHHLAVFRTEDGLFAVENQCLHVGNPLDDGYVSGGCVTCPWHGWRYDLRTGEHLTVFGRRRGLRTYPVRLEGDQILVKVED